MAHEILLVDDDWLLLKTLSGVLAGAGYAVRTATSGEGALAEVMARRPDLLVLDVLMPQINGLDVCRAIRADDPSLPIAFLTALESSSDEVEGLEAGGDLYIPKTTPDNVLLARIAAMLRPRSAERDKSINFAFGGCRVEPQAMDLVRPWDVRVPITERELYLLRLFAAHPGEVLSRDFLVSRLWKENNQLQPDNALSVAIHTLRQKLGASRCVLRVVRGVGYVYEQR